MAELTSKDSFQEIPAEVWENYLKSYVARFIRDELERFVLSNEQRAKELSLLERVIRVEEELKALREIEAARFEAIEKRFEALQKEMNARFEAMDKRFEALQREMNARFEAVDKRFEAMDKRFTFLQWIVGIGFSAVLGLTSLMPLWLKFFQ